MQAQGDFTIYYRHVAAYLTTTDVTIIMISVIVFILGQTVIHWGQSGWASVQETVCAIDVRSFWW